MEQQNTFLATNKLEQNSDYAVNACRLSLICLVGFGIGFAFGRFEERCICRL